MTRPTDFILPKLESEFENLMPGETRYVFINIPMFHSMDLLEMNGYIELDDGEVISFTESSYFVGMMKVPSEPTIDGKIEPREYSIEAPILADKEAMIQQITNWGGLADLSGTVYLNYDSEYFYIAAKVRDNVEGATEAAERVWANDSIQFGFAKQASPEAGRTEIGIGKDNKGNPTMQRYSFLGIKFFAAGDNTVIPFDESCKLEIGREGDFTIYEVRIPWVDIYSDEQPVLNQRSVLFSIIINDNDGEGRRGWMEFCPGIGGVKNAALFMKIPVMQ